MGQETPDTKIERYLALREHIAAQNKAYDSYLAPFKEEQKAIENWLLNFCNETKQESARTEHGTAYKSIVTVPKVTDRDAYLDFCMENWETGGNAMLQIGAPQVSAFKEYIDANPNAPSGTAFEFITKMNIRKG